MKRPNELLRIAQTGYLRTAKKSTPLTYDTIAGTFDQLHAISEKWYEQMQANADDHDLTPEGKAKRAKAITATFLEELKPFDAAAAKINERVTQMFGEITKKGSFPKPTDPAARIEHVLVCQEIRRQLQTLDPTGRLLTYLQSTNPLVIEAIESAPPSLVVVQKGAMPVLKDFIDPERIAAARTARARAADPQAAEEMDALQVHANLMSTAVAGVREGALSQVESARPEPELTIIEGHGR